MNIKKCMNACFFNVLVPIFICSYYSIFCGGKCRNHLSKASCKIINVHTDTSLQYTWIFKQSKNIGQTKVSKVIE